MKNTLKYRTAGGQIVTWTRNNINSDDWGAYTCDGCGRSESASSASADKHAQNCRVI